MTETQRKEPVIPEQEKERIRKEAEAFSRSYSGLVDPFGDREYGYIAGAESEHLRQREWIKTIDRLPTKPGKSSYEHVDCLIFYRGQILQRPWNCEHLCWDDEDYDDYFCDPLAPTHWRELPEPPLLDEQQP